MFTHSLQLHEAQGGTKATPAGVAVVSPYTTTMYNIFEVSLWNQCQAWYVYRRMDGWMDYLRFYVLF